MLHFWLMVAKKSNFSPFICFFSKRLCLQSSIDSEQRNWTSVVTRNSDHSEQYCAWTWYQIIDETLEFCLDTTIPFILLGKEVNELLEDGFHSVIYTFLHEHLIIQKQLNFWVPSSSYSNTYLCIQADNWAKMNISKIKVNCPTVYIGKIIEKFTLLSEVIEWYLTARELIYFTKVICSELGIKLKGGGPTCCALSTVSTGF